MGVSENSGYPKTAIFLREHDDNLMELEVSYLLTNLYGDNRFKMIFLFFSHLRQIEHMSDSLTQQNEDFFGFVAEIHNHPCNMFTLRSPARCCFFDRFQLASLICTIHWPTNNRLIRLTIVNLPSQGQARYQDMIFFKLGCDQNSQCR